MIKYQYTKELLRSTALFLSLALIRVDAMQAPPPPSTPIEISGKGRVRTLSINRGYTELVTRDKGGDLKAQRAISEAGGDKAEAIRIYNTSLQAPSSGSSAFHEGVKPAIDYSKFSHEEMIRLIEESNKQIQAQLDALIKKAYDSGLTYEEETKIMPYLEKQLETSLPDRISYEEHKLREQREKEMRAVVAQAQSSLQAAKDQKIKEAEDAKKAEYKEAYDRVRSYFRSLPVEVQQKIEAYYSSPKAKSTMWELLYLSNNEKDFNNDLGGSGPVYYERQFAMQKGDLKVMNKDELHALTYLVDFMPNSIKRKFHLDRIRARLSGELAPQSSIELAQQHVKDAPPPSGGKPGGGTVIPPPPSGGKPGGSTAQQPKPPSADQLQEQIRLMRERKAAEAKKTK